MTEAGHNELGHRWAMSVRGAWGGCVSVARRPLAPADRKPGTRRPPQPAEESEPAQAKELLAPIQFRPGAGWLPNRRSPQAVRTPTPGAFSRAGRTIRSGSIRPNPTRFDLWLRRPRLQSAASSDPEGIAAPAFCQTNPFMNCHLVKPSKGRSNLFPHENTSPQSHRGASRLP
jgi:hypothetical protein